jgi:hypothetical protein
VQRGDHDAAAGGGGRLTPVRAAQLQRLAGDHGGLERAVARPRVGDPAHGLHIDMHVGRHDVAVGAQRAVQDAGVAARDLLSLGVVELLGRAGHAALAPAEGQVGQRGLDGHELGQRARLLERDRVVEAQAALVGAAHAAVLHAVAHEHPHVAVGAGDGYLHGQLALGRAHPRVHPVGQSQLLAGVVEEARGGGGEHVGHAGPLPAWGVGDYARARASS